MKLPVCVLVTCGSLSIRNFCPHSLGLLDSIDPVIIVREGIAIHINFRTTSALVGVGSERLLSTRDKSILCIPGKSLVPVPESAAPHIRVEIGIRIRSEEHFLVGLVFNATARNGTATAASCKGGCYQEGLKDDKKDEFQRLHFCQR